MPVGIVAVDIAQGTTLIGLTGIAREIPEVTAHRYAIVAATVEQDLPPLVTAVRRMRERVGDE